MHGGVGEAALQLGVLARSEVDGFEHGRFTSSRVVGPLLGSTRSARRRPTAARETRRRRPGKTRTGAVGQLLAGLLAGALARLAEALLEPGDAAAGVEDLLLAGVEGVAGRADVGVMLRSSRCCAS
jgi:hypothetical protein